MFGVSYLLWGVIALYVIVARGLPKLISWILCRTLNAEVKIGRISLIPFSLKDIVVNRNGYTVVIDSAGLSSNFVNSAYSKILVVYVSDVRIEKQLQEAVNEEDYECSTDGQEEGNSNHLMINRRKLASLATINIPPQIISLSQITAVHVYNVNVMVLKLADACLLHAAINEVKLEGITDQVCLQANMEVTSFACKVLHHVREGRDQPCVGEINFSCSVVISMNPKKSLKLKAFSIGIHPQLEVVIYEELLPCCLTARYPKASKTPNMNDDVAFNEDMSAALWTYLPETLNINVENSSLHFLCETRDRNILLTMKKLFGKMNLSQPTLDDKNTNDLLRPKRVEASVILDGLGVNSGCRRVVTLSRAEVKFLNEDEMTESSMTVSSFSLHYYQEDTKIWIDTVSKWIRRHAFSRGGRLRYPHEISSGKKKDMGRWKILLDHGAHKLTVELWDITTVLHFRPHSVVCSGLTHAKFMLEGKKGFSDITQSTDGLLESWWCHLGERPLPENPNKKHHYWDTPIFIGVLLFKATQQQKGLKVESMVDCAHFEWTPTLEIIIMDGNSCVQELLASMHSVMMRAPDNTGCSSRVTESTKRMKLMEPHRTPHVHITITNTNIFALCKKKVGFLLRADVGSLESHAERIIATLEGIRLAPVVSVGKHFYCTKSNELKSPIIHADIMSVTYRATPRSLSMDIGGDVLFNWTTSDHLVAYHVSQDIASLKTKVMESLSIIHRANVMADTPKATPRPSKEIALLLKLDGWVFLTAQLAVNTSLKLGLRGVSFNRERGRTKIQIKESILKFDGNDVVSLNAFTLEMAPPGCSQLRAIRMGLDRLEVNDNRVCKIDVDNVKICFPYKYDFAEVFSEKGISILKWLKALHGTPKHSHHLDPLPSDIWFKVKETSIEIYDDPFEVRLRDNYELLEDEYNESEKRWKMLDNKVDELRKTHLHLPATKVDELYRSLAKRNGDIYVKRSRQMYAASPMRTQLFIVIGKDIEILAMADPTMHGFEKIVNQLRVLDPDSPWPEEDIKFSTLWCRAIQFGASVYSCHLRDHPSPLLNAKNFTAWGVLVGAEQEASKRAKRTVVIEIGEPWADASVERSMPPLKFYYDLSCDVEDLTVGHGPCWEPAIAELNLAFDLVSKPSADPSPPLPFWDKIRLLMHGRLTMMVQQLTMVLHASLNPYNTTEEMDFTWTDMEFDWTNGRFVLKGNLDVYVRTASKYDDCHLLHFPNLKLVVKLDWLCLGNPYDHHAVMPCAPDKLPEYSINETHDSYRAFRSVNLNLAIAMDTRSVMAPIDHGRGIPSVLFYSNTLKWLENLKVILSGVTRPIRRGVVFHNTKPRKISLSRHFKTLRFSLSLHQFEVCYWMSFAKQRGFRVQAEKLTLASEYSLTLFPIQDGLKHRPQAVFNIVYINCELCNGEIWLQSADSDGSSGNELNVSYRAPVEKNYFLSLSRLSYGRETDSIRGSGASTERRNASSDTPTHRLVMHDLRGSWTQSNRTIVFGLFDSFVRNKLMRHNISTEALKGVKVDPSTSSPMKSRGAIVQTTPAAAGTASPVPGSATSPLSRIQSGHALGMLQKLISEADNESVVFSEDLSGSTREQVLHGVAACQTDDVLHCNWLVELINSQVFLKGCETPGYVIMSAARAQILQRIHHPVWKDRTLVSKTTWVGSLECMQYYATVESGETDSLGDVQWLTLDNIEEKDNMVIADFADLVGSGQGVGGVVSNTVGGGSAGCGGGVQLQRIVSRCGCQFFYASYGESVDPNSLEEVPHLVSSSRRPSEDSEIWKKDTAVDSFTLTHHDLDCCTNSLQYLMLLDIVNNLLLYVEPGKREATEKLQRLRFQLQLSSIEDQRQPILLLQNSLRLLIANLRRLEKETYMLQKALDDDPQNDTLIQQMESLEAQVYDNKVQINARADELAVMISCFKETQLSSNQNWKMTEDRQVPLRRRNEVCFKHAQWRLTDADGQLGIADIVLSNFIYGKVTKIDDSVEHLLELGYVKVTNCLPNQIYKDVLQPTELRGNIPIDRQCALRIFCREKAPVGGISIKEHFEVNVVPITLRVTHQFFKTMLKFCFPEKDADQDAQGGDDVDLESASISSGGSARCSKRKLQPRRTTTANSEDLDDIDKMKERAEKNKMFLYIKIPEVPVRVSYKGEKEKNIEDVHDFNLVLQTLEYHNVTWTWLDLLLAMKNDSKKALLSQAIKQKLQIKSNRGASEDDVNSAPQEEDKVRMLMGTLSKSGTEKSRKHHLFGKLHKMDPK